MNKTKLEEDRRLVPRWNSFEVSAARGELGAALKRRPSQEILSNSEELINDWKQERTLITASELLYFGVTAPINDEILDAANYVEKNSRDSKNELNGLAQYVLQNATTPEEPSVFRPYSEILTLEQATHLGIREKKQLVRINPRNSIAWMDLARLYLSLGLDHQAERACQIAIALNPQNRMIIRSAARMYIHLDQPDQALHLIKKSEMADHDVWVKASEISILAVAGKRPRNIRQARELLNSKQHRPFDLSELNGALATLEMQNGAHKISKKLFKKSLQDPTENALAQAFWVRSKTLDLPIPHIDLFYSFEADTRKFVMRKEWKQALDSSIQWTLDEPYSSWPACTASYLAASLLEDYDKAIEICDYGLIANHENDLINNKAVSLAYKGETDRAASILQDIDYTKADKEAIAVVTATQGLIAFRKNHIAQGRELYLDAIEKAAKASSQATAVAAAVHLAKEEFNANTGKQEEAEKRINGLYRGFKHVEVDRLIELYENFKKKTVLTDKSLNI